MYLNGRRRHINEAEIGFDLLIHLQVILLCSIAGLRGPIIRRLLCQGRALVGLDVLPGGEHFIVIDCCNVHVGFTLMKETFCNLFLYTFFALYTCQILLQMSSFISTNRVLFTLRTLTIQALTDSRLGRQIDFI